MTERVRAAVNDWGALARAMGKDHQVSDSGPDCRCGGRMVMHSLGGVAVRVECPDCGREPADLALVRITADAAGDGPYSSWHYGMAAAPGPGYEAPDWTGDRPVADVGPLSYDGAQPVRSAQRRCRYCSCTDDRACAGGCSWVADDVCSSCLRANLAGVEVASTVANAWGMAWDRADRRWRRAAYFDRSGLPPNTLAGQLYQVQTAAGALGNALRDLWLVACRRLVERWRR